MKNSKMKLEDCFIGNYYDENTGMTYPCFDLRIAIDANRLRAEGRKALTTAEGPESEDEL